MFRILLAFASVTLIGVWLVVDALRRGYYLEVEAKGGKNKLRFDRRLSRAEIESFLATVRQRLGYEIATRLPPETEVAVSFQPK